VHAGHQHHQLGEGGPGGSSAVAAAHHQAATATEVVAAAAATALTATGRHGRFDTGRYAGRRSSPSRFCYRDCSSGPASPPLQLGGAPPPSQSG